MGRSHHPPVTRRRRPLGLAALSSLLLLVAVVYGLIVRRGFRIARGAPSDYAFFLALAVTLTLIVPVLVGPEGVAAANALAMTVRQAGVIVGPLLAGVLIGVGDIFLAYTVDAAGFVVAALLLRGLPPLPPGGTAGPLRLRTAIRGVGEGFAFLRTQPVLLMTFVVDIIAMLFAWPQAVFPELSATRFVTGAPRARDGDRWRRGDVGRVSHPWPRGTRRRGRRGCRRSSRCRCTTARGRA